MEQSLSHNFLETLPSSLSLWTRWRSLRWWSCIFHRPWPRMTEEYMPCVMMGARMLFVCLNIAYCYACNHRSIGFGNEFGIQMYVPESIRIRDRVLRAPPGEESISFSFASSHTTLQNMRPLWRINEEIYVQIRHLRHHRLQTNNNIFQVQVLIYQVSLWL